MRCTRHPLPGLLATSLVLLAATAEPSWRTRSDPAPAFEAPLVPACPTLRWDAAPSGTEAWELVVYPVDARGAIRDRPSHWAWLPAEARSWTPDSGDCLEPGRRYAWSVRGLRGDAPEAWSETLVFQISDPASPVKTRPESST